MLKKPVAILCLASSLALFASGANALDITVNNNSNAKVAMAFSYLDANSKEWMVDGWYNIEANNNALININTSNGIYYLYAEFENGKKIEGGPGSVKLEVAAQSFIKTQSEKLDDNAFEVNFVRAKSDGKSALINIM